jgi:serine/threonine protein kinase
MSTHKPDNSQTNQSKLESWADQPRLKAIKCYEPLWGSWSIENQIGEGAFGKVYRIRRQEYGQTYYSALKIISIPHDQGEIKQMKAEGLDPLLRRKIFQTQISDIIQEINLMSEFSGNSHIVSFEDHKVIDKTSPEYLSLTQKLPSLELGWDILIRMELLTSLADHIAQTPLSTAETVKLGIHICQALELCAKKNIIHRDVKPNNILVSRHGEYKLGDFGLARQLERTMDGLSKKGTTSYMAPEVFNGSRYGTSVDIYGLGIVLYTLLNRNRAPFLPDYPHPIFPGHRDQALQKRINGDPIPPLTGISPPLNEIILKACAYDSQDRFASPTEMREALESVPKQRHTSALPHKEHHKENHDVLTTRLASPNSNKPKTIAILAALSAAVVLALITAIFYLLPGISSQTVTTGYGISINGQSDIILSGEEEAKTVLEGIKSYYIDLSVPAGSTVISSPTATFEEIVEIVAIPVQTREIKDEQEALQTLINGKSQSTEQTDIIHPYLTVIIQGVYEISEEIDFERITKPSTDVDTGTKKVQQKGIKGSKDVTYTYIFKNGSFVERTSIEELITRKPVSEIILEGTGPVEISLSDKGIDNAKLAAMIRSGEIPENVTELNLSKNKISDLTPLKSLTYLQKLSLDENNISDLTPLKSLTDLTELSLCQNKYRDSTPLKSLTGLKYLNLDDTYTNYTFVQKAEFEKALPHCKITWYTL